MCDYCNGLNYVIGLNSQVKLCPVCADTQAHQWVETHRMSAWIHALRFGLMDDEHDDADTYEHIDDDTTTATDAHFERPRTPAAHPGIRARIPA